MATVLLGVTGSIAAYKACELTRLLVKGGHDVHVIMTQAATHFVVPLTFRTLSRNPVCLDLFDEPEEWVPGHISLAERADALVIAPCSANVLAKLAHGLADDMLTATALATGAPLVIAPAMNTGHVGKSCHASQSRRAVGSRGHVCGCRRRRSRMRQRGQRTHGRTVGDPRGDTEPACRPLNRVRS